jgi:KTSC domain
MPSTAIEHISYDEAGCELHVKFVGGGTYTYYGVAKSVYEGFRASSSRGTFFNNFIKSRYDFRRHAA